MSKIHISEQKARKIIRSLIENHMDFDSEAVRRSSQTIRYGVPDEPLIDEREIDILHSHILEMKDQVREMKGQIRGLQTQYWGAINHLRNMIVEINESDFEHHEKEWLRSGIISILNDEGLYTHYTFAVK
jgi:hypothetical protein